LCDAGSCAKALPNGVTCADDGNVCTNDLCSNGVCVGTANTATCDDGKVCTVNDTCAGKACQGVPKDCDDGNTCTADACDATKECVHSAASGACDDGNKCSTNDTCTASACKGTVVNCDDGNACTTDGCVPATGCQNPSKVCDDGNTCTTDACDAVKGCTFANASGACDDANKCSANDSCDAGACKGTAVKCDDGNACTADSCESATGCKYTSTNKPEACDDVDNDCNGETDEGCDDDNDDYCDVAMAVEGTPATCSKTKAVGGKGDDCKDTLKDVNPGAAELCDDLDNNCAAGSDEGCDDDNDDYCDSIMTVIGVPATCKKTDGGPAPGKKGNDCADTNDSAGKAQFPGNPEVCGDALDNDCAGGADTGCGPAGMVLIPAGTFWMGCNATKDTHCSKQTKENPQHKVKLSPYYIDVKEVTVADYAKCFAAGKCQEPGGDSKKVYCNWDTSAKKAKPGRDQHPVNCVSWIEAQNYCKWRGAMVDAENKAKYDLPTEAQWEMAARGDCAKNGTAATDDAGCKAAMRTYPWGNQLATCSLAVLYDEAAGGCGCGGCSTLAVGSKPAGVSPYGLHDMSGNAWEWVRDVYGLNYYSVSPLQDPFDGPGDPFGNHGIRGGNFNWTAEVVRAGQRNGTYSNALDLYVGLRCGRSFP